MCEKEYEFTIKLIGFGETVEEAWEAAKDGMRVEEMDVVDVEPRDEDDQLIFSNEVCPVCDKRFTTEEWNNRSAFETFAKIHDH